MITFLIVGLAAGVLARLFRNRPGRPQVMVTVPVAVVAAILGGVLTNLATGAGATEPSFLSVGIAAAAALVAIVVLEVTHPTRS
ncbi:MAG: hypothetical protein WAW88_07395 [Nocardioides sp.]